MKVFNKPQKSQYGWFVSTHTKRNMLCEYLHTDGKLYKGAYNDDWEYTGYFRTELAAFNGIYDYSNTGAYSD